MFRPKNFGGDDDGNQIRPECGAEFDGRQHECCGQLRAYRALEASAERDVEVSKVICLGEIHKCRRPSMHASTQ